MIATGRKNSGKPEQRSQANRSRSPLISAELERSPPLTRRAREAWPQERRHRVRLVLEGGDRADQLRTAGVATGAPTTFPVNGTEKLARNWPELRFCYAETARA